MKKYILFIIFLIGIKSINAQDVIVLRDAPEIESKVLEIDETNVRYKKWDNPDGPTYIVKRDKILFVRYENGTKEVFNPIEMPKETISKSHNNERPLVRKGNFQTYLSLGYYTGNINMNVIYFEPKNNNRYYLEKPPKVEKYLGGIFLTGSFGVRINDYAYIGFKTGVSLINYKYLTIPIVADFRAYFPINRIIHPFIEVSQGIEGVPMGLFSSSYDVYYPTDSIIYDYSHPWYTCDYIGIGGRFIYSGTVGIGLDVTAFSISMGWSRLAIYNSFYIRMGINPCWNKILKNRWKE